VIEVRPLRPGDWPNIERLFGERGACAGCWCMWWRRDGSANEVRQYRGEANRIVFRELVQRGEAHGVLAFDAGEPVGWCSIDAYCAFPALERKRSLRTPRDEKTWSITCFFIRRDHRSRGVATALTREAVRMAFSHGATRVEAYPAKTPAGGGALPDTFAWTGTPSLFRKAGFVPLEDNPRVFVIEAPAGAKAARRTRGGRRS
jgi:GNAT superfamily N-acetyltransferase